MFWVKFCIVLQNENTKDEKFKFKDEKYAAYSGLKVTSVGTERH